MKRFIVFGLILLSFVSVYNASIIRNAVFGFFGDTSYQKDDLLNAKKHYTDILDSNSGSTLLAADTLYNLGNTLYKLGEKEINNEEKVKLWEESVGDYTKSLSIRIDKQTEENLVFVQEKLKQEKKKQEEERKKQEEQAKKDEQQKTQSGSEQKKDSSENKDNSKKEEDRQKKDPKDGKSGKEGAQKSGSGTIETSSGSENGKAKSQSGQSWSNGGSYNSVGEQGGSDINSKISDADRQEVKKYIEELKKFGKENGKLLNPDKGAGAGSLSDQIRNFFGNDSFFQDILPSNDGKKDW